MFLTVSEAAKILLNRGIVAIPTETVYGLAGIATDSQSVQKIYKAKNRPPDNPLIIHFFDISQVKEFLDPLPLFLEVLIKEFSPGPLSYLININPNSPLRPSLAGQSTVVFRIPDNKKTLQLLKILKLPLAAPSANSSGTLSPTSADMVLHDLGDKIDGIIKDTTSKVGLESTILDCRNIQKLKILRPGAIGKNEIIKKLHFYKDKIKFAFETQTSGNKIITPGSKYHHYKPKTKIYRINSVEKINFTKNLAIIGSDEEIEKIQSNLQGAKEIHFFKMGKSPKEIASNFYHTFFKVDQKKPKKAFLLLNEIEDDTLSQAILEKVNKMVEV